MESGPQLCAVRCYPATVTYRIPSLDYELVGMDGITHDGRLRRRERQLVEGLHSRGCWRSVELETHDANAGPMGFSAKEILITLQQASAKVLMID